MVRTLAIAEVRFRAPPDGLRLRHERGHVHMPQNKINRLDPHQDTS